MLLPLLQVVTAASAASLTAAEPDPVVRYDGRASEIVVLTPSVADANISIDARLDDASWSQAALLDGFTQYDPVEGIEASQRTEVLVIVDEDAIYFGVRAFDDDPSGIRATLSARDSYTYSDDYIRFVVDTFNDQRRAYVFTVNPLGVQHDGLWNEGGGGSGRRGGGSGSSMSGMPPIDQNPDFLWDSEGRLTEWGYEVEVRIPFKSLRFPEVEEQSWGLQVERKIQRNGFASSWAPSTRNVANKLTQIGTLSGLRDLDMGMFLELNPVVTGSRSGALDAADQFVRSDPTGDVGFNVTYGLTSNLTLDGTINPDFSQIEADAGQVQVNERFALFFAEKRPFFLEGTEIFGMPKQLVYTRTIANPIAGGKLTGKVGALAVGYLGAVDQSFGDGPDTYVNLARIRKDVGASSTIGAIYTDRTVGADEFNRVMGADARMQLGGRYTITAMGARSFTADPAAADRSDGTMTSLRFERAGRGLSFSADFLDTDEAFRPGSGYFQRLGETEMTGRASYNFFGRRGGLVELFSPSVEAKGYWNHDTFWDGGPLEESELQAGGRVSFRGNMTFWFSATRRRFAFLPEAYDGLYVGRLDGSYEPFRPDASMFSGLNSYTVFLWVNTWERVRGNIRYTFGASPVFDRTFGVPVLPARSSSGSVSLNFYPTQALSAEVRVTHSRLVRELDEVEHSSALIPRLKAQYQFSREVFLRGIFEYGSQESLGLVDPDSGLPLFRATSTNYQARTGSTGYDFRVEGLLGYEPSPGTVFYFGYTREMEDASAFGFEDVRPTRDGLFVKLSYRLRM